MFRFALCLVPSLWLLLASSGAVAHDASAYGGVFRSRNLGATWLNADVGLFLNAALTVAVDPLDPAHLLIGTELGLQSSRNGGRSWNPEAKGLIVGAVFAVAFAPDGRSAICASPAGLFRFRDGEWRRVRAPAAATPARAIAFGAVPGHVYLLGRNRLFHSVDGGETYQTVGAELPDKATISALAVVREPVQLLLAVVDGKVWASEDGGNRWRQRGEGLATGTIDTVVADPEAGKRVWAGGGGRIYRSDDLGLSWRAVGQPLPERATFVRGIAADAAAATLVVSTQRGLYRSEDQGQNWMLKEANLPVHLESGPLARDPTDPKVIFAVYSLIPYSEVWRTAIESGNLLQGTDPNDLVAAGAFLVLTVTGGVLLTRWLVRLRAGRSNPPQPLP